MHKKKMIGPVIIAVLFVLYYAGLAALCVCLPIPTGIKIAGAVIPLILAGVCIYVLIQRINEIRSGEEDDLSKY